MSAPAVAVSVDGKKLAAAWKDVREGRQDANVYWAISDNGRFTNDTRVHSELTGEQNHPTVAIGPSGNVWVAWEDGRAGSPQIWARSTDEPEMLVSDAAGGKATFPALAVTEQFVALVYEVNRNGSNSVMFRLLRQTERD